MELQQYFKGVVRWWWLILLSTSLAAIASYLASSQQPRIYQTTTTMMVGQVIQQANPSGSDFFLTEQLAESYAQIARRQPVLQGTVDNLGLDISWQALGGQVYVYPIPRTQLLGITVQDTSPERAVVIADEIARQLILQSPASPNNQAREERSGFVRQQLVDLEGRIETAQDRVKELKTELDAALSARQIRDLQTEITGLEDLINRWQITYTDLLDFLQGGDSPNYLTIIEPAQLPTIPISPKVAMNVLLAAAVGFVLAVAAALVLEFIDDTIKSADDLNTSLHLAALGSISRVGGKDHKDKLILSHSPFDPLVEAYRGVRTNIQFMAVDQPAKSILITSATAGEGKSITVANLAVTMATANLRTIIIDADLRRPNQHKIFGLSNTQGLTDLLRTPKLEIESYLKNAGFDGLQIVTSGPLPSNSAELLGSARMIQVLHQMEEIADVIILDTPPVMALTDPVILANRVDGVVLVVQAKHTRRKVILEAIRRLQQGRANLLGGLVNQVSGRGNDYYYYSHYHRASTIYSRNERQQFSQPGPASRRWWQRLSVFK